MNFSRVEKIAAAILYEGYILYPYRPSSMKNRQRWNFGTLYPRVYAEAQIPPDPFCLVAECIVEAGATDASLDLKIQFLQLLRQQGNVSQIPTHSLTDPSLAWEEATERTSEQQNLRLSDLVEPLTLALQFGDSNLPDGTNLRQRESLQAQLTISAELLPSGARKIHLELQNTGLLPSGEEAKREEALPRSFVSAHVLMGIHDGQFVSLLDPPETYHASVASCQSTGVFPVLAGEEPDRSILFCSPIILYDYPKVAPESEGDFFDGAEMDEMLTLRVLTLTDAEKREMRHGDPRARKILERTESMTAELMMKAHGVIRGMRDIREDIP